MFTKNNKDSLIQIRCTEQQKKEIKKLADKENKSVTDFILTLVQEHYNRTCN